MNEIEHVNKPDNRQAILDAMGRLMERLGYSKTTIDDIAKEVGIGKGSVYLCFKSKEEIALTWLTRLHCGLAEELQEIAKGDGAPEHRALAFLMRRVLFRADIFVNHSYTLEDMMASLRDEMKKSKEAFHAMETGLLADILAEIGGTRNNEALTAANAMIQATNGQLPYRIRVVDLGGRQTIEETTKRITQLMIAGYKGLYGHSK
jgi:AcrR family transcriptional regulator